MNRVLSVLMMFQRHLTILWRAFLHPRTPLHLKAAMVGVVIYLISPVDLLPDFFMIVGWIDDVLLVTFAINWIMKRLPPEVLEDPLGTSYNDPDPDGPTIDGTFRRR